MGVMSWVTALQRRRRSMILIALITTFAGLALVLNQPERTSLAWGGIPLVAGGAAMLVGIVWPASTRLPESAPSLASSLIRRATWDGRLVRLFPMLGVMILAADLLYNLKLSASPGLTFVPQHLGIQVTVIITTACSGIYSFGIFASAFLAFVLTEFRRPTKSTWLLLSLGLVTSYAANVLRMVVIVLIGYYTDTPGTALQNLLVAHSYAGWLIFLGWIALFWSLLFKFGWRNVASESKELSKPTTHPRRPDCTICHTSLTPALEAVRCRCGSYLHSSCFSRLAMCPTCGILSSAGKQTLLGNV